MEYYLSLKREGNPAICDIIGEPCRHYAKGNKALTAGQTLHDSTYVNYLKLTNSQTQRAEWWLPRTGVKETWGICKTNTFKRSAVQHCACS